LAVSLLVSMAGGATRLTGFLSFWSTSSGWNWTMTAVMLSHPVPSPRVLGARQWSNSCKVTSFLYYEMPNKGAYFLILYKCHSISHGNYFLTRNMATWETEYECLKACVMYLWVLPSDGCICTMVHTQFACRHHCVENLVCKVEQCSYMKIAVPHGRNAQECHAELCEALGDYAQVADGLCCTLCSMFTLYSIIK
jgi:hypothetical protein